MAFPGSRLRTKTPAQAGFTYLALLFLVAIMGATVAAAGTMWSFSRQREKEQELLLTGTRIRKAIESYYLSTPGTIKRYPMNFNDLLKDNRQLATVRHLRRLYLDPMSSSAEWGIVHALDGGIQGVYSLSSERVIKRSGFGEKYAEFEKAETYRDWRFVYEPQSLPLSMKP